MYMYMCILCLHFPQARQRPDHEDDTEEVGAREGDRADAFLILRVTGYYHDY